MGKNLMAKTKKWNDAYEYRAAGPEWITAVLKHYQSTEAELKNEYARVFAQVFTVIVPEGEMGDTYLKDAGILISKERALQLIARLQGRSEAAA